MTANLLLHFLCSQTFILLAFHIPKQCNSANNVFETAKLLLPSGGSILSLEGGKLPVSIGFSHLLQTVFLWSGKSFLCCGGMTIANNPKCVLHTTKMRRSMKRKKNTAKSGGKSQFIVIHGSLFLCVNALSGKFFLSCEEQDSMLIVQW